MKPSVQGFRIHLAVGVAWAAALLLTGCPDRVPPDGPRAEHAQPAQAGGETVDILDGNDQPRSVRKPVRRIIVEYMDNAELVRILDRTDRVVGVAGYDYIFEKCTRQFPEFRTKQSVGLFWALDYETVLGMRPDLLLTFSADTGAKQANLPGVDVLFLGLYYPDLLRPEHSKFIRGVRNLGLLLDARERAGRFIDWHTGVIARIKAGTAAIDESRKPKVLLSSYPRCQSAGSTYCAYPSTDTLAQACLLAGGVNLAPEPLGSAAQRPILAVETEWLMRQKPDIILLHAVDRPDQYGYETDEIDGLRQGLAELRARPELADLPALRKNKIFVLDGHLRNDASGGVVAAAYMARIFHPEAFGDLDPEEIQRQYLAFQGLAYDLDRHGVFVYPPLAGPKGLMGVPDRYQGASF